MALNGTVTIAALKCLLLSSKIWVTVRLVSMVAFFLF